MNRIALLAALGGWFIAASAHAQTAPSPFPPGDNRDLVATNCTQCHGAQAIVQLRMNEVGWRNQVYNMVLRGAQIGPDQLEPAVQYLATAFGPGVPFANATAVNVSLPDGDGKNLVEGGCQLCHGLDRVTATRRTEAQWTAIVNRMAFIGSPVEPSQKAAIAAYLSKNYGVPTQTAAK